MIRFAYKLMGSQGLQQSAVTVVGNVMSTGLSAVAMIVISRLLGPLPYGQFSVGFAIVQILARLNDAGLNATILKFAGGSSDQEQVKKVVAYTLKLKLILSLVLVIGGIALVQPLSRLLNFDNATILTLSFVLSLATTWYEHLATALQAVHRFTQAVLINTIQASFKLVGVTALWLLGLSQVIPVYFWYMFAPFISVLFLRWLLPKWLTLSAKEVIKVKGNAEVLAMARHSAVGFIAAGLIENLDVLFVQRYLDSYETGLLAGVSRIAMMLTLVAYSLGNVLNPRVARYKTREHLQPYLTKALIIGVASVVGFIAFLPFSRIAIRLTIGPAYLPGEPILLILMAASFLTLATIPFLALFYSFRADWYFSISGVLQLLIVIGGNWWFVPEYGLTAAAWTKFATRLFLFIFTVGWALWHYYRRYHRPAQHPV